MLDTGQRGFSNTISHASINKSSSDNDYGKDDGDDYYDDDDNDDDVGNDDPKIMRIYW